MIKHIIFSGFLFLSFACIAINGKENKFLTSSESICFFKGCEVRRGSIDIKLDKRIIEVIKKDCKQLSDESRHKIKSLEYFGKFRIESEDRGDIYLFSFNGVLDSVVFYEIFDGKIVRKGILSSWSVDYFMWGKKKGEKEEEGSRRNKSKESRNLVIEEKPITNPPPRGAEGSIDSESSNP